ncbi:MAG: RHS repeat-associated core domain-containing protein, partial [Phycisphaerae bacterium]|nr:RHS repeat-associated core domain-containing protein [Phycisphaerae bacterium]
DLDNDGTIEGSATEDDYVILQAMDNTSVSTGQLTHTGNPYYFTGRRVDVLDGGDKVLQYSRNRYMDYETGRWLSHDPLGYTNGVNLYGYVGNKPLRYSDPLGLLECDCTPADCSGLTDINNKLNQKVNETLRFDEDGVTKIRSPYSIGKMLGEEVASTETWPYTSNGMEGIQAWIQKLGEDDRQPKEFNKGSGYRYASCISITCHGKTACIGADKIGHFFLAGLMLWEIDQKYTENENYQYEDPAEAFSLWTEGLDIFPPGLSSASPRAKAERNRIIDWLENGKVGFFLYPNMSNSDFENEWGNIAWGWAAKKSEQDHYANMAGRGFYTDWADYYNQPQGKRGDKFKFNICDYVNDVDKLVEDYGGVDDGDPTPTGDGPYIGMEYDL